MQFSPLPCYLVPLRPKYSPQYLFSNTHSLCSSLKVSDQVSHPYKTTLNILIFVFLNNRRGQKILRRICDYIFKLLIITESQLDRIALQSRILYVAEWITVCEANFPCRRFCTPPHDVQSNVYCRTPAVTPSDLLSHFTVQYRFKNRRSYKSFTLGDVVINLSQTKCLHFEFIKKHRRFVGRSVPSKAYVYRPLIIGVAVSSFSEDMDVCLLCLLCVVEAAAS